MGGFGDWVETIADAKTAAPIAKKVSDRRDRLDVAEPRLRAELQGGLLHGRLPAGDDVIGAYQADQKSHLAQIVKPLQKKEETIYVTPTPTPKIMSRAVFRTSGQSAWRSSAANTVASFLTAFACCFSAKSQPG